jgi:diacylglycerol kinase family enzyme
MTFSPAPSRVVAIINPNSGMKRGRRLQDFLQARSWGVKVKSFQTLPDSLDGHREALHYAQQTGADRLIVAGGDGTLMETLTVMMENNIPPLPICMIRAGTGNIVASDLNTPRRMIPALRRAFQPGMVQWWDLGQLEDTKQVFALRTSAGHDALTLASMPKGAKQRWGTFAYALPAIKELLKMKPVTYRIQIDELPAFYMQGITAFVAVTNRMAGIIDFVLSHDIYPDDGVLHVGVINPEKFLQSLPIIINQKALQAQGIVKTFPVRERVQIEANPPQLRQVDGELLPGKTPFAVRTIPQGVPFVVPMRP